jgi:hypothetical protein
LDGIASHGIAIDSPVDTNGFVVNASVDANDAIALFAKPKKSSPSLDQFFIGDG